MTTPLRDEVNLRVRLRGVDAEYIEELAKASERSVSAELRMAVRDWINRDKLRKAGREVPA